MRRLLIYIVICLVFLFNSYGELNSSVVDLNLTKSSLSDTTALKRELSGVKQDSIVNNAQINAILYRYLSPSERFRRNKVNITDPQNIFYSSDYNFYTNRFFIERKLGDSISLGEKDVKTLKEYVDEGNARHISQYWKDRSSREAGVYTGEEEEPGLHFGGKLFDAIFGSNKITIRPQGSAEVMLGIRTTKIGNPTLPEDLRKTTVLDFDEKLQMNVSGAIGERLKLDINYNTEATFDYENQVKLNYEGQEDEIVKSFEAGNVSLPLSGTLINGGQNLFGFKTALQFGKLTVTSVFSQQKGESSVVHLEQGAQKKEFEIKADSYDENRHFFLSHKFKDSYDNALRNLPVINSDINIVKVEVWVTNKSAKTESARNIIAFTDIGEGRGNIYNSRWSVNSGRGDYPDNKINNLYEQMLTTYSSVRDINKVTSVFAGISDFHTTKDYEKVENARQLSPDEYTVNEKLGYISLNRAINTDEVLAVAYEYTVRGQVYRVGEFTADAPDAPQSLYLKLLKGTVLSPSVPQWELMMKNIYNIGAYSINPDDFILDVLYRNDQAGNDVNYISAGNIEGKALLSVMNLDNLNKQLDPYPDGIFDFIDGITVLSTKGRIIFPVREPFGSYLRKKIGNNAEAEKYVFEELYTHTLSDAKQLAEKNKFLLKGSYKSSSGAEINLNSPDISKGAVKVVAGSRELVENIDYTVDYAAGRVNIINQAILESGVPIKISSESNSMFDVQTKTLLGTHFDYRVNDNLNLGATILHYSEKPITHKVNIGNEPVSNTIWGVNGSYSAESEFLTRLVNKIPLIETDVKSRISADAEFAHFIPGHNSRGGRENSAYIDDFEGSKISIDLKAVSQWKLASTPQDDNFPEGKLINDLKYGYNRAKIAWYMVDPLFYRKKSAMPGHIKNDAEQRSNHYVREIKQTEVFPNKDILVGDANIVAALNIAYYPEERGPYNFDVEPTSVSAGINEEGKLNNPQSRWGGIMRRITTNDFDAANIQYIEFWVMDPFVYNPNHSGGDLCFDLGNISEDILRDSRKSFENGLPVEANSNKTDTTKWGRVPKVQSLVNGFDNNAQTRRKQDVGLDGLSTEEERSFFVDYLERIRNASGLGERSKAYASAYNDPAGDDYHYFRGSDYDAQRVSILERYKRYNNPEGNSPTSDMSPESYPTSATSLPDNEDINLDNTLSETESFYRYRIPLHPTDMRVGRNFISDIREANVDLPNGKTEQIKWYQFKIPITEYQKKYGDIENFNSIRFARLLLKGFRDSVVLRMASLDLVRDNWRKYDKPIDDYQEEHDDTRFDISAVNIEENAEKEPVNYILPPGIDRALDATNPQLRELNEQSMVLRTINLHDGDARAVFKSSGMNILRYKRLKMDVHAEHIEGQGSLRDGDLHLFIRLGTDYRDNYYEYEIPLKLTPSGYYPSDFRGQKAVWPDENQINIPLEYFQKIKILRNKEIRDAGSGFTYADTYRLSISDLPGVSADKSENKTVSIAGNPTLADVQTVMIGIRNPKSNSGNIGDDGLPKSAEIWVNELRLSDFDERGGWAANMRVTAQMADFASLTVAGTRFSPGFGSLEQRASEVSRDDELQYDIATNVELGKFFPEDWKVRIPVYYAVSAHKIRPEYDPTDTDIPLDVKLDNEKSKSKRDSIKRVAEDVVKRKSLNFTNVGVRKTGGESKILDISNLSLTYSYSENEKRNINTVRDLEKNERGLLNYTYNGRPKLYEPFKNSSLFKSSALNLFRDINFYLLPSQLSFRSDLSRRYRDISKRNLDNEGVEIVPTYDKDFMWNRYYDMRFNLTRNLKFDFSASALARIDETEGIVDREIDRDLYQRWRDTVWNSILEGGRTVQYHHNFTISYRLPVSKIPGFRWLSSNLRYSGNYDWQTGAITEDDIALGNEIRNSNTFQINTNLNMLSLYNKSKFLRGMRNSGYRGRGRIKQVKYEHIFKNAKKETSIEVKHNLKTKDLNVRVISSRGRLLKVRNEIISKNKIRINLPDSTENVKVVIRGRVNDKPSGVLNVVKGAAGVLLSVNNISLNYSENNATSLSGYMPESGYFGMESYNGFSAPGFNFIAGFQDNQFARKSAERGWLTDNTELIAPYIMTTNKVFTGRASLEPVRGLRIDLTARRAEAVSSSEYINFNSETSDYSFDNKTERGNFSMTYLGFKSSFFKIGSAGDYSSASYNNFVDGRKAESRRLAQARYGREYQDYAMKDAYGNQTGYYEGYTGSSQDVLIPSFLSAYGYGSSKGLIPKLSALRPNWNINFSGMRNISFIKKIFKSFNLTHRYSCTYNIGSYITNLDYNANSESINMKGNYISEYDVNTVSVTEQFSPLINADMVWNNNITTTFEISRRRNIALSIANMQISENTSNEIIFGCGYRFDRLPVIIGNSTQLNNDLNLRCDFSIRKNNTIIRKINEDIDQLTAGQKVLSLKLSADYTLNSRFNLRLFYDKVVNTPYVSLAYPTTNANFGVSVRFSLAQ